MTIATFLKQPSMIQFQFHELSAAQVEAVVQWVAFHIYFAIAASVVYHPVDIPLPFPTSNECELCFSTNPAL